MQQTCMFLCLQMRGHAIETGSSLSVFCMRLRKIRAVSNADHTLDTEPAAQTDYSQGTRMITDEEQIT